MEILATNIEYTVNEIGLICFLIFSGISLFFIVIGIDEISPITIGFGSLLFITTIIIFCFFSLSDKSNFLNKPEKIVYTIEVTDENEWKNIATNYIVKDKPCKEKEIYIIEGDYDNANNY